MKLGEALVRALGYGFIMLVATAIVGAVRFLIEWDFMEALESGSASAVAITACLIYQDRRQRRRGKEPPSSE
ncbi:hypothetical protein SAMN05421874_15123 [Nonomuraea maritima]|uniref:Uncharacterized protein n=1 Tax=Nonomuraea maritima TaxID=683260 RepID=A0A1G9S225_9ACTN|nr:hypothetical protein [Nonomuraea maritima]SDM29526.1 hypothetical protein SAMN05421874_15123 [Nonomuraea maritima]